MTDFEKQVLSDLAVLKTQMRSLVGNGHPGLVQEIQARVDRHEAYIHRIAGVGAALAALLTIANLILSYLRIH